MGANSSYFSAIFSIPIFIIAYFLIGAGFNGLMNGVLRDLGAGFRPGAASLAPSCVGLIDENPALRMGLINLLILRANIQSDK